MLAEEIGGSVAQGGDGIVDEGESAFGVQLVDDVGKGMDQVLVALLQDVDSALEAPVQGDEGAEVRGRALGPTGAVPDEVVEGSFLEEARGRVLASGDDDEYDRIGPGRRGERGTDPLPGVGADEEETFHLSLIRRVEGGAGYAEGAQGRRDGGAVGRGEVEAYDAGIESLHYANGWLRFGKAARS